MVKKCPCCKRVTEIGDDQKVCETCHHWLLEEEAQRQANEEWWYEQDQQANG